MEHGSTSPGSAEPRQDAVEHTDAGAPSIEVSIERSGDRVRLIVADEGPGIPEDERDRLLRSTRGTSVGGLQIVQTLVGRFDGELRITDNEPRGTVVTVELPLAPGGDRR